ncbi:MAG: TIGR04133 family radical SAM/SPASM protein [Bacteroidales bacterium]|nr:TIGR04133 family radical SAM/SPASM protein [Candidatus Colimorpha onthohippi]
MRHWLAQELFRAYRHNNAKLHPLRTLFWECTLRCNMSCLHCGSDCKVQPAVPDMPAADFFKVIDDITPHVDPHTTFVVFIGGEVLLRPDLDACGLELYRRGFPWGLVTNGYLLTRDRLERLQRSGLHSITVSIDGLEDDHNWLRQNPYSFVKASEAIRNLSQAQELVWDVVTCVNPRNYSRLEELKAYLYGLGVRRWRVFTIFPMGRAAGNPELKLSPDQLRGTLDFIKRTRAEGRMHVSYACEGYLGDAYELQVRNQYYYCRSGVEVASVLCDGHISGCTSMRSNFYQGSIYTDNFWDVWQNRFEIYRDRSWTHKGICKQCKAYRYCEGNGLHLYDDNGNLLHCHYQTLRDCKE